MNIQPTVTINGVDYSARLRLDAGITITRGRQDQLSTLQAGTAAFTLDNTDGGLDALIQAGTPYPVVVGSDLGGTRFTGSTTVWQQVWPGGGQEQQTVRVTCTDLWSSLERKGSQPLSWQTIQSYQPVAFWPLIEGPSDDPRAFNAANTSGPDLVPYQLQGTGTITWAAGTQAPLDASGTLELKPGSAAGGWYLGGERPIVLPTGSGVTNSPFTVHCTVNTTQADSAVFVVLQSAIGGVGVNGAFPGEWIVGLPIPGYAGSVGSWHCDASTGMMSDTANVGAAPNTGATVSVTFTYDGNLSGTLWVGENKGTLSYGSVAVLGTDFTVAVGGWRGVNEAVEGVSGTALLSGSIGNVAVWDTVLTDAQIINIARSEQTGIIDTPANSIARWLGWTTGQSPDTGGVTSPASTVDAPTTSGALWKTTQTGSVAGLLRQGEQTEAGLAYVDRSGVVQFMARHTTRTLPSLTIDAELVDPTAAVVTDWRYAVESATATSTSGEKYTYSAATGTGTTTSVATLATASSEVRSATQWAVNSNQLTTKFPTLGLDLATLDATTQAAAAALDLGSPLILQRIPSRPASDPYTVQGYQETISNVDWSLVLNIVSAGPGSGADLLIWDDATFGVWDAGHRWDW